ncbi:MAG: glycosyltransferase family 39 protein [Thermodesulfobacteriota bacterium]|nr:glycosyltransferase family 39 protein [Thermodesulfobacteriota bacterium]
MNLLRSIFFENRWFVVVVILSLLLKIAFLLQNEVVNPDGALYIAAAEKYAHGLFAEGARYYLMPFYPMLLAAIHLLVPNWIIAGQLLTVVPLVLVLWPLYVLTRRLFDEQSALWATLLFALLPIFNQDSTAIIRDPLFLLFVMYALMFLVNSYLDCQVKAIIGFVLFTTLALLTRIEGVLLPLISLWVVAISWWHSQKKWAFLFRVIIYILLFATIAVPMLYGLDAVDICVTSRMGEVVVWIEELLSLQLFAGYQQLMHSLKQMQLASSGGHYHNNLFEVTRHYAPLIYLIGLAEMVGKAMFPTTLLALFALRWRSREITVGRWILLLVWLAFLLLDIIFVIKNNFITERYLWIPVVVSLPWIGYGVHLWWLRRGQQQLIALLVVVLIVMAPLSKSVAVAARTQDNTVVTAGRWLRDYDPQRQLAILYNDRRLPLYANRVSEVTKVCPLNELRKSAYLNEGVEIVALYLSNKKNEVYAIHGFEPFKVIKGLKKTVVFLKRQPV